MSAARVIGTAPLEKADLHFVRGTSIPIVLRFSEKDGAGAIIDQDFTGWTVKSQIRASANGELWLEITPFFTLTDEDGVLTIAGLLPPVETESAEWSNRTWGVWDLDLHAADGRSWCLVSGKVRVIQDVTR